MDALPDIEVAVIQSSDDAGPYPVQWPGPFDACSAADPKYSTTRNEIYFGHCPDGTGMVSGFRFQDVAIQPGSVITAAYLEFTVDGLYTNVIDLLFRGELVSSSATFGETSRPSNRAPLTAASVVWHIEDWWWLLETRRSPDLGAIIQEIIDQPDWANGNDLAIVVEPLGFDTSHRRVFAWDRNGIIQSARLQILHTETAPSMPPPAPTKLTAVYDPGGPPESDDYIPRPPHVALTWAPASPLSGTTFNVYRSRGIRPPIPLDTAHRIAGGLVANAYDDFDGQPGDIYVVTAVNTAGESDPSNTATAR